MRTTSTAALNVDSGVSWHAMGFVMDGMVHGGKEWRHPVFP